MNREAIVLVAGMGTRLKPLTLKNHKCLTEVNGVPILENALSILENNGISRTVLVVGYLKEQVMKRIGNCFGKMEIVYAENDAFSSTNTSFSLKCGLEKTGPCDEVLILEGDVFFDESILRELLEQQEENLTVLEKYNQDLDGTFAEIDDNGFVIDWTHKSQRPEGYAIEDKYKTVNIHRFTRDFIDGLLKEYLTDSITKYYGKEPLENVMMRIVQSNPKAVKGMVLCGEHWFEIDDINDLAKAEKIFG